MVKITIFGLAGTGTTSVGEVLAKDLRYEFESSGNIFRRTADEEGYSLSEFGALCQRDEKYDKMLDEKIGEYGKKNDNFVVESRLAWHFIPDSIKIKLNCDFDVRVKRVAQREGVSYEEARNKTIEREESENERYEKYYGLGNYYLDENFDLVVDATEIDIKGVEKRILDYLKENKLI